MGKQNAYHHGKMPQNLMPLLSPKRNAPKNSTIEHFTFEKVYML